MSQQTLPHEDKCYRCKVPMVDGVALRENYTTGVPDFPGDVGNEAGQTMFPAGYSNIVNVRKCPKCGHSYQV